MEIKPIAHIRTNFTEKFGIPRQSGRVESLIGRIVFEPEYRNPEALRGIEEFSHLWLLFDFSLAHRDKWSPTVRPPRLGGNARIGVFASRSPFRPNSIGLSCVKFVCIEQTETDGSVLVVSGVDLLDGTPIYDIKPYVPYADSRTDARGSYSDEFSGHRLNVVISEGIALPEHIEQSVIDCIADDPRPSYQNDPDKIYGMKFGGFDIHFSVDGDTASILSAEPCE